MIRPRYAAFENELAGVDASVLLHQMPGGMYSNMVNQLREQNALDRLEEVLEEMPRVRKDFGYPPLVTPTSQIVGSQAVLNVLLRERYKTVTREARSYLLGYYGRPPAPLDPEVQRKVAGAETPIDVRPGDVLPPELPNAVRELAALAEREEDILSYALFPEVARAFFEWRAGRGPELETVAAIAVALSSAFPRTQAPRPRIRPGAASSAWRVAGRQRALR
jgi:pyruvate carboxylase subunit B